jgi:hypothetical protein
MVNSYVLVNPHIEGKFDTKIKAKNSLEAANLFYKGLSEHFNNSVPQFYFTIQKGSSGDGKYSHFKVKENRQDNEVSYSISPYEFEGQDSAMNSFTQRLANFKAKSQDGGKKRRTKQRKSKDSSESLDSDSDYDYYRRARSYPINQPIYYWWYDPSLYRLDSLFIPTFYSYVTPYIELSLTK